MSKKGSGETWLTGHKFVAYIDDLLDSPVMEALSPLATKILHHLGRQLRTTFNGQLKLTRSPALKWLHSSNTRAFAQAVRELVLLKLIVEEEKGMFRLTFYPAGPAWPKNEWKQIQTYEEAKKIIGEKQRREQTIEFQTKIKDGTWPTRKPTLVYSAASDPKKMTGTDEE
jgi:hypothetical protein